MSATDELLEKLRMLKYDYDSMSTSLEDAIDDIAYELEQAIAATLGGGTMTADDIRDLIERHSAWVIGNNRCFHNGAYEEIADELNATLGRPKAKAHPYGYEPDTGAFDATRCECGCINDISARYCNDCGGEIEIDVNAEKEIYHTSAHMVFVEKHDDGSLEFAGKRYIAATLGRGECECTTTRKGKYRTRYGRKVPLCECCGYAIGDDRYNFCPKCGAKIVEAVKR